MVDSIILPILKIYNAPKTLKSELIFSKLHS